MRAYREYRCDHGHEWTVATQQTKVEAAADAVCPEGHEAVTCSEALPADEVQVLLRPAARVVDGVTARVSRSGRYYLVLLDRADRELCASNEDFSWDDAIKLAGLFRGKEATRALEWWRRKAL